MHVCAEVLSALPSTWWLVCTVERAPLCPPAPLPPPLPTGPPPHRAPSPLSPLPTVPPPHCAPLLTVSRFMSPPDTPTMVGKPSSRATTAKWDSRLGEGQRQSLHGRRLHTTDCPTHVPAYLPRSITSPEHNGYSGTQPGSVRAVTRISPLRLIKCYFIQCSTPNPHLFYSVTGEGGCIVTEMSELL